MSAQGLDFEQTMAPRQPMPDPNNQYNSIARYNQKNPNLNDGTAKPGWFYPTPAEVKKGGGGGNEECYYPHFLFDSQFTYGAIHRYPQGWLKTSSDRDD